jgi:hypothetical protein
MGVVGDAMIYLLNFRVQGFEGSRVRVKFT